MTVAAQMRKGSKIEVNGVVVRVVRREKWNSMSVKLHFEDCGNGLPTERFGSNAPAFIMAKFYKLTDQIEVL